MYLWIKWIMERCYPHLWWYFFTCKDNHLLASLSMLLLSIKYISALSKWNIEKLKLKTKKKTKTFWKHPPRQSVVGFGENRDEQYSLSIPLLSVQLLPSYPFLSDNGQSATLCTAYISTDCMCVHCTCVHHCAPVCIIVHCTSYQPKCKAVHCIYIHLDPYMLWIQAHSKFKICTCGIKIQNMHLCCWATKVQSCAVYY